MAEDFYSFEKVLRELHLQEEELKKLVSEGEIRAFRDDDKMKFKKEDIERFKTAGGDDLPTIEAPTGELTEELFGDDEGGGDDVGMVTQEISDSSFLDEEITDIEPIELESAPEGPAAGRTSRRRTSSVAAGRSVRRRGEAGEDAPTEGTAMQVLMVLGALVLLWATIVAFDAAQVQASGLTGGLADFMQDNFMK